MSTLTVYPDANPETDSVDGEVAQIYALGSGQTWATIKAAAGSSADDTDTDDAFIVIWSDNVIGKWRQLRRSCFLFLTSALGSGATISSATFSVYGTSKYDQLNITPNIGVYSSAPASSTALAAGDFDSLGTTPLSDTIIEYADFSTTGYNDFALNATGLAAISKTGVTKLGCRNHLYDVGDLLDPTWSSDQSSGEECYFADQAGTTNDPKLVVVYTAPVTNVQQVIWF